MKLVVRALFSALFVFSLLGIFPTASALTIIPVWDTSITSDPNGATIENTINAAIQFYEARLTNPMTISIQFQETTAGLGESEWEYYIIPYTEYYGFLQNGATTTNDAYALEFLSPGPGNPVTGDININVKTANLKALDLNGLYGTSYPNGLEGYIFLNTSSMNLSRASINPSLYDLQAVAEHEIDEILGLGSDLPNSDDPFPEDLFRYSSTGGLSFTTAGDDAWFSLDGVNLLQQFNQQPSGDFGDWWSTSQPAVAHVQDAYFYGGESPNPNIELVALDVIGYDLAPPPSPGLTGISVSGNNLWISGTNGLATATYILLASTNLSLPLNQWSPVWTNTLSASGNFAFTATNVVPRLTPREFYALQVAQ